MRPNADDEQAHSGHCLLEYIVRGASRWGHRHEGFPSRLAHAQCVYKSGRRADAPAHGAFQTDQEMNNSINRFTVNAAPFVEEGQGEDSRAFQYQGRRRILASLIRLHG